MTIARRDFLKASLTTVVGATSYSLYAAEQPRTEQAARMRQMQAEAKRRRRRIIYNDDGCHTRMYDTPEKFLSLRLRQVVDTQVDTVFYCTGVTGLFLTHFPRVGELIGEFVNDGSTKHLRMCRDSMATLKKSGHDPLSMATDFSHGQDKEVFWSFRMNDVHDAFVKSLRSRYKREHPDWCLAPATSQKNFPQTDPRWWWTALNYEVPEVRDWIFRIFEDVCGRYDVDGIELDFFRMPMFFEPTLELKPVAARHVEMMTDLVRRIRQLTEQVGQQRGRPLLVACRVPMDAEQSLAIGLDVRTWLEEDLFDLMVLGGGYAPMAMAGCVRKMVDLGHNFDVPVYPCISKSGMRGALASIEAWRGAAMNIWHTGADGVYTFNLFPRQRDDRFSEIGDVATLKGRDKFYGIDKFDTRGFLGIYKPGLVVPYALPVELEPDVAASVELPVGEDIIPNSPSGQNPSVKLRLQITNVLAGDSIETKVNGRDLPLGKWNQPPTTQPATRWYELEPDPTFIKAGTNRVEIRLLNDSPAERPPLSLVALKMPVGYR